MAKDYKVVDNVLIINEGRTEIGSHEFFNKRFSKVIIPEGVTEIGYWAFGNCNRLKEVVLPASLESIAREAFPLCPLEEVVFTDGCPKLKEVYISSFDGSPWEKKQRKEHEFFMFGTKLFMHGDGPSVVVVPDGVETIGDHSFAEYYKECVVEEVTIPEGVKIIEPYAFGVCKKLTSIHLPQSLESIGNCAFVGCEKLTSIHLPQKLESIGEYAFSGCEALKEIVLPDNLKTLGAGVFCGCTSLERIVFPVNLKSIGENPFTDGYDSCPMNIKTLEGLIPSILNGCKLSTKASMWFLENLWTDENSLKEIAILYLTQSGTKVLDRAELILWRNQEQAVSIMKELKATYKLKPATIKKIDAFVEKYT